MTPVWSSLPIETLRTAHKLAKSPSRGLRPFFKDPHEMIRLRDHITQLEQQTHEENRNAEIERSGVAI